MEVKVAASNGINIYHYKQPNTHSICISLYVKTGVLYENDSPGISHFLEHLHFRRLGGRGQRELYYDLESIGAYFCATTYKEFMYFYLTSSPKYFSRLAEIASDLLGGLEAEQKDFTAEKRIILSEIREDNQHNDIEFVSNKLVWEGTNLKNPVLGSASSVKSLTLEMLKAEKEKVFTSQNVFFYVTGNFTDGDIDTLKCRIDGYDLSHRTDKKKEGTVQIPLEFQKRKAFAKISDRKYLMHDVKISFDVDFSSVSRRELLYLDSILSEGLCSLLRTEMIEKRGLVYSFSSTVEQYNNIGVYYFKFDIYKSKLYDTIKSFISVLKAVKKDISEKDMLSSLVFKTDNQLELLDDPQDLNWTFAYENHILNNNYSDISAIADAYRQISGEQLLKAANSLFSANNAMLVSIGNKKGLSEERLHELLLELG